VINDDVRIERESLSDVRESEAGSVTTAYTAKAPAVLLPDTEGAKGISQDVPIVPMSDDPSVVVDVPIEDLHTSSVKGTTGSVMTDIVLASSGRSASKPISVAPPSSLAKNDLASTPKQSSLSSQAVFSVSHQGGLFPKQNLGYTPKLPFKAIKGSNDPLFKLVNDPKACFRCKFSAPKCMGTSTCIFESNVFTSGK
jgi:hypothetical protein